MSDQLSRLVPLLAAVATLAGLCAPGAAVAQSRAAEAERRVVLERMVDDVGEDYPDVATISAAALRSALPQGDFVLVDVRTDAERRVSTLPGAITSEEFEARLQELADRTVVAYCTIGRRSSEYVRGMARRGVDMLNLEGSVLAWTHVGGQLVSEGVRTRRLHVYGRRWNLAADGYQTIW
ncbi:MAG: rhodanese-like domain-containing protein [Gemmatimonadetes bacterium]|nr:rhodanese-like domain-containing protein [Gemmatimonadota bacterium]MYC92526.1 rhodanese-like domain-containing protein [Gemmatimonadota bacterium]MYJ16696.1 rhodanese-like domain-containing protein [Gemmatimonadota bacterium]